MWEQESSVLWQASDYRPAEINRAGTRRVHIYLRVPLFPDGVMKETVYVRECQSCNNEMETTYYSDVNGLNTPVCFFCGDTEVITNQEIQNLKQEYGLVRPICDTCFQGGKRPAVRNALKTNKKK